MDEIYSKKKNEHNLSIESLIKNLLRSRTVRISSDNLTCIDKDMLLIIKVPRKERFFVFGKYRSVCYER